MARPQIALPLALLALLAGCGKEPSRDVGAFLETAETEQEHAILSSIATYRTTPDEAEACELVSERFLESRFEGELENCHQLLRAAPNHLPDTAEVQSVEGTEARVFVDEPTATTSIYVMRREDGTWKIEDIVENA